MATDQLRLRQLNRKLGALRGHQIRTPSKGWIREIRTALGMSASQLARRLGVSQPAVAQYEKNEVSGAITLGTLSKTAEALECELVYALVPRADLGEIREQQAQRVAERVLRSVSRSMDLENQPVSNEEIERQVRDLARQILGEQPRSLWNEP